jgi:methylthioribulose-1-phosphate dehydratase
VAENFSQLTASLASIASDFYSRGWVLGTSGNLSAVVNRAPLCLAMSPSGLDKGSLTSEHFMLINGEAQSVGGFAATPSAESRLHIRVVKERAAGAVLHTHSVWSTMLSDLHAAAGGFAIVGYEMLKGLEGVRTHEHSEWLPIIENSQDMTALAEKVGELLRDNPTAHGFLLRRHGLYSWGDDLAQAKRHVEILEFLLETVGRTLLAKAGAARAEE